MGALAAVALLVGTASALANGTASHTVTVIVQPINEVSLEGGDLTLTIDTAEAGNEPEAAIEGQARLLWTTNQYDRKITVATDRNTSNFELMLEAVDVSGGTSTGAVRLASTPQDLIVGISTTVGSADLLYTATAGAADGIGREVHTVSFTITAAN